MNQDRTYPALPLAVLVWAIAWMPAVFMDTLTIFDDLDERLFHHPTVQQFAQDLPWPDLRDYRSATTPLYHLLLSPLSRISEGSLTVLRLTNLLISCGALWAAVQALSQWGRRSTAVVGGLLIGASPYFVGPAVRLSTDNAALLCVFLVFRFCRSDVPRAAMLAGAWATAAVMTRQIHLWAVTPIVLVPLLQQRRWRPWLGWSLLPAAALAPFVVSWGGLTPPSFAAGHQRGLNLDALVMFLGVLGVHACCVAPWIIRTLRTSNARLWVPGIAALCGALLSVHSMPWVDEPNRIGGALWSVARHTPEIAEVPAVFWIAVPAGGLALLALFNHPRTGHGRFMALAALSFALANLVSGRAYQKYYDPMALFFLASLLQGQPRFQRRWSRRLAWAFPIAWALVLVAISALRIYG